MLSVARLITRARAPRYTVEERPVQRRAVATALVDDGGAGFGRYAPRTDGRARGRIRATAQPGLQSAGDLFPGHARRGVRRGLHRVRRAVPAQAGRRTGHLPNPAGRTGQHPDPRGRGTEARVTLTWTQDGLQLLIADDGLRAAARRTAPTPADFAARTKYTIDDDLKASARNVRGQAYPDARTHRDVRWHLHAGKRARRRVHVTAIFPSPAASTRHPQAWISPAGDRVPRLTRHRAGRACRGPVSRGQSSECRRRASS